MENLEKPLTWVLVIVLLGYLFATKIGSENDSSFTIKNPIMDIEGSLNVDSIIDAVIQDIDMKGNIDTLIEIELEKETTEE
tara:strand:- start:89 stop:331 length:243 start_codon:yes stop_codon:yes gene_type:complete